MKAALPRFIGDDRGLTLVEYVAGGALVALFLFATLNSIFTQTKSSAMATNAELSSMIPTAPK